MSRFPFVSATAAFVALLLGASLALSLGPSDGTPQAQSCPDRAPLRRPYFGDLHVHTAFSLDASTMGTVNRPADAYRFARGEELGIQPYAEDGSSMRRQRLARPLDFAAVTDHAELIGEWYTCNTPGAVGHDSWVCRMYRFWPRAAFFWMNYQANTATRHDFCGEGGEICLEAARGPWSEIREAAATANDRCEFTSFVAYEWTGGAGVGNNFHRNVVFANEAVPELPTSFIDAPVLSDFYATLDRDCTGAGRGCDVVVIPHNTNLSGGLMFQTERPDGSPIDAEDARARRAYEVLVEVMQHKGESECMFGVGTEDELCNFENLAQSNFRGRYAGFLAEPPVPRQFIRNILLEGLQQEQRIGVNPFKLGFIASTDTHLGTPGLVAEAADYPGHGGAGKPPGDDLPVGFPDALDFNPGGLAVVWAEENTRQSLFDGLRRRETYGTSGPRIAVRFFGGWDLPRGVCAEADVAASGYAHGVAMGGDLGAPPIRGGGTPSPVFVVSALRDAGVEREPGTPLQRVQIIKGWLEDGEPRERVYEVAGDPDNGASVDLSSCEPHGEGFDALCGRFQDPDFDPKQPAFYYARVVENPTCRWSQRLCVANGVSCQEPASIRDGLEPCCDEAHQPSIQERAWTSPIWYRPTAG